MRIGFLGPFSASYDADYGSEGQIGAIEHQIFGLGKELSSRDHEVFITRNWKGKNKENLIEKVHFVNVNLFGSVGQGFSDKKLPLNRLSEAHYLIKAPERLRKLDLDVINVSGVLQGWFALESICTCQPRSIFITHNNDIYVQGGLGHSRTSHLTKKMLHVINARYDATIATTRGVEEYFRTLRLKCHAVIPEAIDPDAYKCCNEEDFVLTASRLVPHKRVEDLIEAYSEISSEIREALVIIGSGPCEKSLKRYAASLDLKDRIRFSPFLPKSKYRDCLSKCSVFVLPSVAEAFGVVIIEAMASGKPVIARNVNGPRDIITHGQDGFLFENYDGLKKYLKLILSDGELREKLSRNARRTVEQRYTFSRMAKRYEDLYDSIMLR